MGFFGSITGFLGHVASEVTHTFTPDLKWEPSSLLQQASKLLPGLADLIPGVGPILSKGISAVESVISGHDTTDAESTTKTVLPDLGEVKDLIDGTTNAIKTASDGLSAKLTDVETHLAAKISDLEVDMSKEMAENLKNMAEKYNKNTKILIQTLKTMDKNDKIKEDRAQRKKKHKLLLAKYAEFEDKISQAIYWWKVHVTELHSFISYKDTEGISRYLGASQDMKLVSTRDGLKKTVVKMQDYMTHQLPPTQEILDLYVLAVTWLLTYNKMILTLRSYWAHFKFTVNNHEEMLNYLKIRENWNDDLKTAIHDAKESANFLLGASRQKQQGFIDSVWDYRQKCLHQPWYEGHNNPKDGSVYSFFVDSYPTYGLGSARFDLAKWQVSQQGLVVIRSGQPGQYNKDKPDILFLVKGLYAGYFGLQSAYFQASTRIAREMAHAWRISADRWQSTAPFSPSNHATIEASAVPKADEAKADMVKHGLDPHDMARGGGYKKGDEVSYVVSYVTSHGEGIPVGPSVSYKAIWGHSFFYLKIKAVEFPKDEGLAGKEAAQKHDKNVTANIVRRVYATSNSITRHVIDISAPPHKDVHVWDMENVAVQAKSKDVEEAGEVYVGLPD